LNKLSIIQIFTGSRTALIIQTFLNIFTLQAAFSVLFQTDFYKTLNRFYPTFSYKLIFTSPFLQPLSLQVLDNN